MKREIEYFLAAAEEKNITKAAQILYVGQPAVSKCITELEKSLNTRLFERDHFGVSLTESGKVYLEYARTAAEIERHMKEMIGNLLEKDRRLLNVAMSLNASTFSADSIMKNLSAEYPLYYLQIDDVKAKRIPELLRKGKYQYAVCPKTVLEGENDIQVKEICSIGWLLAVPKDHLLARENTAEYITPERGAAQDLILQDINTNVRAEMERMAEAEGIRLAGVSQTVSNTMMALKKAEDGDGCVIIPEAFRALTDTEKIQLYKIDTQHTVSLCIAWMKGKNYAPGEEACIQAFVSMIRKKNSS